MGNKTCQSSPVPIAQLVPSPAPNLLVTSNKPQGQTVSGAAMTFLDMDLGPPFSLLGSPAWELSLQL